MSAVAGRSGRRAVTRVTLLPELHAALATWGSEDPLGRERAEALRDHLAARIQEVREHLSWRATAREFAVSVTTLQRWHEPGQCCAPRAKK